MLAGALVGFGVFAAERRGDRASNTLRRELLDLGPVPSPRPEHGQGVVDDSTAHTFAAFEVDSAAQYNRVLNNFLVDNNVLQTSGGDNGAFGLLIHARVCAGWLVV